jgi:hypothetical protein
MKKSWLHIAASITLVLVLASAVLSVTPVKAAGGTITSTATGGAWTDASTWVGGLVPGIGDSVVIATTGGESVIMTAAVTVNGSLTINSGAELATNDFALILEGDFVNNGTFSAGTSSITIGGAALTQNIAGFTTTGAVSMTKTAGTATLTGNVGGGAFTLNGVGGTLNLGTGFTHVFSSWVRTNGTLEGGSSILKITGSASGTGGTFSAGTGTVLYEGAAQNVAALTYYRLKLVGTGTKTALGDITVNENLLINSGSNFTVGAYNLTVTGNTSITGTLTLSNVTGTKTFNGAVTVNANGVWNNSGNAAVNFHGGLTFNGKTFTAGTGLYTFDTTASQAIGGSSVLSISNVAIGTGLNLTNNNTAGFTVSSTLSGAGTLTQGAGAILNIGASATNFTLATLVANAAGNTVNYNGTAQTVKAVTYHNLTLSTSGVKTITGLTTINGNLLLSGTASALTEAAMTIGGNLTIDTGAVLSVGGYSFAVAGTTTISGSAASTNGKLVYTSLTGAKSHVGLVTINTNGIWDNTIGGDVTLSGGLSYSGKTFTAGSGLYTFQTTASQAISGTGAFTIPRVAIGFGVNLTNNNTNVAGFTISTELSGAGTLTQGAGATLNIGASAANFTLATLVADASGNTVNYNGSAQTVRNITYHHLTLSTSGSKLITGLTTINGNLTLSGTASASTTADMVIGGNLSVGSGTSFTVSGYNFTVTGATTVGGTLFHDNSAGTKVYMGAVTVTGSWKNTGDAGITFQNGLSYTGASANETFGNGVYTFDINPAQTISGTITTMMNLTVANGVTLTNNGTVTVGAALSGLGAWVQGPSSALFIGGTSSIASLTASATGNTVSYSGISSQTVLAIPYYHLDLSGSVKTLPAGLTTVSGDLTLSTNASATLAADLTVGGLVNIASGTTLDVSAANYAINVSGYWTCAGTFTPRSGTVTLQGIISQTVNAASGCPFYNLVLNNGAGATLTSQHPTVNNVFTLSNGKLNTGSRTLYIGATGSIVGADSTKYIIGPVRKTFNPGAQSFTFPIGDATAYTPVDLTIASVTTLGYITAQTSAGEHANVATLVGINAYKDVNRSWTLTPASIVFTTYDANFHFVSGDVDAGADPNLFVVKRYASSAWNSTTLGTRTLTSTQVMGIPFLASNTVYSYAIGEGDSIAPTITNVNSSTASGYYKAGALISGITVTFSEAVDVTGFPQLTLDSGAVLNYSAGTGTNTLTFEDYIVVDGQNSNDLNAASLALNGGTIKDAAKNAADLTLSGTSLATNKNIVVDTTAPNTQIDTKPTDPSKDTLAAFTYSANESSTFECQVDGGAYGACASPYTLAAGLHTFGVVATDLAGNKDASPASYSWTIDTTPPTVSSIALVHTSPTSQNAVQFTVNFSEPVTGVDPTDFFPTVTKITGASVTAVTGSGSTYTVTVGTGTGNGTLRLDVLDNDTIVDAALNPLNGAFALGPAYTVTKTLTYQSLSTYDGWILESGATTSAGGTMNSTATTFNLGDDAAKKQYRAILHFNTATLPDNAVITSTTLKIMKSAGGTGSVSTLGALLADMTKPSFNLVTLETKDFQTAAGKPATFNPFTIAGSWYSATMKTTGYTYVNRLGTTQFRLYYTKGDDADGTADYLLFYSGNAGTAYRPQLIVTFYVPMP